VQVLPSKAKKQTIYADTSEAKKKLELIYLQALRRKQMNFDSGAFPENVFRLLVVNLFRNAPFYAN